MQSIYAFGHEQCEPALFSDLSIAAITPYAWRIPFVLSLSKDEFILRQAQDKRVACKTELIPIADAFLQRHFSSIAETGSSRLMNGQIYSSHNRFYASAREAIITPSESMMLVGAMEYSTGIHDDLFARVLVLSDSTNSVAIVTLDLIGMGFKMADEIRSAVCNRTGISHVLLCCSHTHSAPFTIPWSLVGWQDFERNSECWRKDLIEKIVRMVSLAHNDMREVVLSVGRENVQIGQNRRLPTPAGMSMQPNPDGTTADWTDVLKVGDTDGNPIAVLFSHAAHPVIVHSSSTLVSADYPGYAVSTVHQQLGNDCIAMFAQGCGGNVNAPWLGGFDIASELGSQLGEAAIKAAHSSTLIDGNLDICNRVISLPLETMPTLSECDEILQSARNDLATAEESGDTTPMYLWELNDRVLILEDLRAKIIGGDTQELRFEITTIKIGQWCLTAMTHELFADYQLWVDSASPFKYNMTLAYTNGCESYIPTDTDFASGGYEAASCPRRAGIPAAMAAVKYPCRLALQPGAECRIKNALTEAWK